MKILIEGIDGTGKSTLAKALAKHFNIACIKHLSKPKVLKAYKNCKIRYQLEVFKRFNKVLLSNANVVYDRAHLGEFVYGPLYRGKACCELEKIEKGVKDNDVVLILLETTNLKILRDDGENFNTDNQEIEQEMFKNAFEKSKIRKKIKIRVNEGDMFKSHDLIMREVLMKIKSDGKKVYMQPHAKWRAEEDYYSKLSNEDRDWILNFDKMENDFAEKSNPISHLYSKETFEDTRESLQDSKKCIMSRGSYFLCDEQGQYENLVHVEEYDKDIEMAKVSTEHAFNIIDAETNDFINSGLKTKEQAEFDADKRKKVIRADEKTMLDKKYSKLTKRELRAKAKEEGNR